MNIFVEMFNEKLEVMESNHIVAECSCSNNYCFDNDYVIFKSNQFYLLTIPNCQKGYLSNNELVLKILNQCKPKHSAYHKIWYTKSNLVDQFFYNKKDIDFAVKRNVTEVNYLYFDNSGRDYAITINVPFVDYICSQEERDESFEKLDTYLEFKRLHESRRELKQLHSANKVNVHDFQFVNSIDKIIKQINKQVK